MYGCFSGYGFVDFENGADAQKAMDALQSTGIQAQMAKVSKVGGCQLRYSILLFSLFMLLLGPWCEDESRLL